MALGKKQFGQSAYGADTPDVYSGVIQPVQELKKKRYLFKIYDSAGLFITTWKDVVSDIGFSSEINSGFSEYNITLGRLEADFDEGASVAYGNILKVYCFDRDSGYNGVLVYSGTITRYIPSVKFNNERVEVTFLSQWLELQQRILEVAGNTTITYTADDVSDILKDLLDKFTAAGGTLDYTPTTVDTTGVVLDYIFTVVTYQEAIKKLIDLAPIEFYLRVGADDLIYFQERNADADHKLIMGSHFIDYKPEKRIENVVNTIYFIGGGSPKFYKKYVNSGSVTAYGTKAIKVTNTQIIDEDVADAICQRLLDASAEPEIRVTAKILDNNGLTDNEKGYDIESLKVGDTVKILNATSKANNLWDVSLWDVDSWDYNITNAAAISLQIMKVQYTPEYAIVELSNKQPNLVTRIEEINKRFVDSLIVDVPTAPTV